MELEEEGSIVKTSTGKKGFQPKLLLKDRILNDHPMFRPNSERDFQLYFLASKPCADPDWETWRNSLQRVVGGHTIAGLLGFGPESAHKYFLRFMGLEKKPEANWFGKNAMQHGKEKEAVAKKILLLDEEELRGELSDLFVPESLVYEIYSKALKKSLHVCVSPDMHYASGYIREIKCPYYQSDLFDCPLVLAEATKARNTKKYGWVVNPAHWIQPAFYSWITGGNCFSLDVLYYCTKNDMCVLETYDFMFDSQIPKFFAEHITHLMQTMDTFHTIDDPKRKYKPYSGLFATKNTVSFLMLTTLTYSLTSPVYEYHLDGTLEEHEPDLLEGPSSPLCCDDEDNLNFYSQSVPNTINDV